MSIFEKDISRPIPLNDQNIVRFILMISRNLTNTDDDKLSYVLS